MNAGPAGPLTADAHILEEGAHLYRLFTNSPDRHAGTFNPGVGTATRFAFFGDPIIPVLYAGESEIAAISETLLHDIPAGGGALLPGDYQNKVMGRLIAQRPLRLASFMGTGFRTMGASAEDVTRTPASRYAETVLWAEGAHTAGFEGIVWMSSQCDTEKAYVVFGDRVREDDFAVDPAYGRAFALPNEADWLTRLCSPLRIEVRRWVGFMTSLTKPTISTTASRPVCRCRRNSVRVSRSGVRHSPPCHAAKCRNAS